MNLAAWIKAHFAAYRTRTKWEFLWRISLEGLVVPLFAAFVLTALFNLPPRTDIRSHGVKLVIEVVILAPFIETLLLQSIPVMIARSRGISFWGQVLATLVPFAAIHFFASVSTGICAGLLGGVYIAFTYVHWRQISFRSALWMTSGSHALHNAVLVLIQLFGP